MRKVINDRKELKRIHDDFVGKEKVQSISLVKEDDNGTWAWNFKEDGKPNTISSDNRDELEKMHMEFGGKNPETCRGPDDFLSVDFGNKNFWDSKTLTNLRHRITKITLFGRRVLRDESFPLTVPEECGSPDTIKSKRASKDEVNLYQKDIETIQITRSFSNPEEFDNLLEFIRTNKKLSKMNWYTQKIGTESQETHGHCVWQRTEAGDGTKRMVLLLNQLNGKKFTECMRKDLFDAADDMFFAPCDRIIAKKKVEKHQNICFFAAEDGLVDISGMEA
jgi:hypothetical protein